MFSASVFAAFCPHPKCGNTCVLRPHKKPNSLFKAAAKIFLFFVFKGGFCSFERKISLYLFAVL
jgi:hypothetical protein